jgi:hypothetical protein
MSNAQRMALVKSVYNLIFGSKGLTDNSWLKSPKPAGFEALIVTWTPKIFVSGTVRAADADVNDDGRILSLRFMEQNMNKADINGNLKQTAIRARNGEFLMWVVDRKIKVGGFLGSIQNGDWIASEMRAVQPAGALVAAAGASQDRFVSEEIPDMTVGMGTAEYVIQSLEKGDYDIDDFDPTAYDDEEIGDFDHEPGE